jgi:D-sedoheptulose 7-phosphate isomerase
MANAQHLVNDLRKITSIDAYTFENLAEITARINDDGWASVFLAWLKLSNLNSNDLLFVLSVGGGDEVRNISPNLVSAIKYAKEQKCKVAGIVGKSEGYTAKQADICIVVPMVNPDRITPHSESFQAVIWHLMVSHPLLKLQQTKWESVK